MRNAIVVSVVLLVAAVACRKQAAGTAPGEAGQPQAAEAGAVGPEPAPAEAGTPPVAADVVTPPGADAATIPMVAGGSSGSGFERFYTYVAPSYRAAGPPPALPIAKDAFAGDPALSRGLLAAFGLDPAAVDKLSAQGFVVLTGGTFRYDDFADAYEMLSDELPIYVTADAVLHLYHLIFDGSLMALETEHLIPLLGKLMTGMRDEARGALALSGAAGDAARLNLAVAEVVLRLLEPAAEIDAAVRPAVEQELAAIDGHTGFAKSAIFGYDEDYTQYVPRGHYTRSAALGRYFRAMMWLGRMTYLVRAVDDPEPAGMIDRPLARRLAAQSALFSRWLETAQVDGAPALRTWERIYRTTAFFAGFSDDVTPGEIAEAAARVLGASWGPEAFAQEAKVDELRQAIAAVRAPRIFSGTGGSAVQVAPEGAGEQESLDAVLAATAGMRFMGQRYTPDADVMGRLIFPAVGLLQGEGNPFTLVHSQAGKVRGFSRGLDVMALLGSPRARPIVEALGDAAYDKFDEAWDAAKSVVPPAGDVAWRQNLYWAWLDVLREVVAPTAPATQAFQATDAWSERLLNAALASWAQLRHDTILYVKQPYGAVGAGAPPPPPPPKGFVDPYPELYAKLRALGTMTRLGLQDLALLTNEAGVKDVLFRFDDLLKRIQDIAVREVENEALTPEDNEFLKGFAGQCDALLDRIAGLGATGLGELETPAVDLRASLVADVLTNIEAMQVLEEASGNLEFLVAVVRIPGSQAFFVTAGPVFSYYEFRHPLDDRLTDEAWREMLKSGTPPASPPWTCSFRYPCATAP